jgi:hypothetical protein
VHPLCILPLIRKLSPIVVCIIPVLVLCLSSCAARRYGAMDLVATPPAVVNGVVVPTPRGVDPALWRQLSAELNRVLAQAGTARHASAAPVGKGSIAPDLSMHLEGAVVHYTWSYRQTGDYDLNGTASIGDLALVGIYYGKTSLSADWQKAQLADGDGNGTINVADVTPIGVNWSGRIEGYELLNRGDDSQPWELFSDQAFAPGTPSTGLYPGYDVTTNMAVVGKQFCARPYTMNGATREYGPLSNIYGPEADLRNHWASERANNLRDGVVSVEGPADAVNIWKYTLEGGVELNLICDPVMDGTNTIYFGTSDSISLTDPVPGWMYAVTSDGKLRWRMRTISGVSMTAAVNTLARVVFADTSGMAYCFTPDGKQVWRRQLTGIGWICGPLLDDTGSSYIVTQTASGNAITGSTLYKLDPAGSIVWSRDLGAPCRAAPCYNANGDITTVNTNSELRAYDASGALTQQFTLPDPVSTNYFAKSIASRGTALLYVTENDRARILAYDNTSTSFVDLGGVAKCAPVFSSSNDVAVGVKDTATSGLKLKYYTGAALAWEINLEGLYVSNIAVDASDRMYIANYAGDTGPVTGNSIRCVLKDQTVAWVYPMGAVWTSAVTLAADNLLVCVTLGAEGFQLVGLSGN